MYLSKWVIEGVGSSWIFPHALSAMLVFHLIAPIGNCIAVNELNKNL